MSTADLRRCSRQRSYRVLREPRGDGGRGGQSRRWAASRSSAAPHKLDLRQPQGRTAAPASAITAATAELLVAWGARREQLPRSAGHRAVAVPFADAAFSPVARSPDRVVCRGGVPVLGAADPCHRQRTDRPGRHASPFRPVVDHSLRPSSLLRATPRGCRGARRRAQRAPRSPSGADHHGLLLGQPQTQTTSHRRGRSLACDSDGNPSPFVDATGLPAGVGVGPVRQLHGAVERQSRRRALPDPFPVRGLRVLPARPV